MKKTIFGLIFVVGVFIVLQLFTCSNSSISYPGIIGNDYMSKYNVYALKIPDNLNFAGEKVPLDRFDVKESFDRELLVNTYWQSNMLLLLKRSNRYLPMIDSILLANNIPSDFRYLAIIESGLMPRARSHAGASGIWQFMKATAKEYGLELNSEVDERYNFEKATIAACKYLNRSYRRYNNWTLVAASYNAGQGRISKELKSQDAGSYYDLYLNKETGRYVYRILALKEIFKDPSAFGFKYHKNDLYDNFPLRKIYVKTSINDLAIFAKKNGVNYKILKYFNPWFRSRKLTNKNKKEYIITLPKKVYTNFAYSDYDSILNQ